MVELHAPVECWVILYWDPERAVWCLDQPGVHLDRATAERFRDLYRAELGPQRVRMLHTADGG